MRAVSIVCATDEELWYKLFCQNYTDYWRGLVAEELCERLKLKEN